MFINTTKPKTAVPGFARLPIRSSAATLLPCFPRRPPPDGLLTITVIWTVRKPKDLGLLATAVVFIIAKLQDDNKALDRLTKSKEAALLDAERTMQVALGKASMVNDLQNKNQELMKQIEICQVLLKMLPSYYKHVHAHDNTLITKFYGIHQITLRIGKKFDPEEDNIPDHMLKLGKQFKIFNHNLKPLLQIQDDTSGRNTIYGIEESVNVKVAELKYEMLKEVAKLDKNYSTLQNKVAVIVDDVKKVVEYLTSLYHTVDSKTKSDLKVFAKLE
ncbi:unnamed protein product [Lactuca saligna]|uniref:Uncharacterized protein n=1 Tax=Lactuca saligna TaxID=75948 RepID=A0AA35Z8K4_LACSI|nr:unnamed protein product [Lactuca saligna]